MELVDALTATPLSEKSGAQTAARFAYQKHWALSEILARYLAGEDCLFIFEYHDDVVILAPASNPKTVEFFQVKTKNGVPWTLAELLKQKEKKAGSALSTLGKLYSHLIGFLDHTKRLYFVTNAHFNFVKNKEAIQISADSLEEKERKKIVSGVSAELPALTSVPLHLLFFTRSIISLEGQEAHVKGVISEFLTKQIGSSSASDIDAWYYALIGEISRKNNAPVAHALNFDQLITNKGFSSANLKKYLAQVNEATKHGTAWSDLSPYLIGEGMEVTQLVQISHAWDQLKIDLLNPANAVLKKLLADVGDALAPYLSLPKLTAVIEESSSALSASYSGKTDPFSEPYIKAAILWVYCEKKR